MKPLSFITLFIALLSAQSISAQALTHYEFKVGEFSELSVTDGVNVDYRCSADSAGMIVFDCPSNLVTALIFNGGGEKGKNLKVQVASDALETVGLPTVRVYSKYLNKVTNTGDSTVRVLSLAPCPKFNAKLEGNGRLVVKGIECTELSAAAQMGNGTLILKGKADKASIKSAGSCNIEADELEAREVSVRAWMKGTVGVWAVDKLSVSGTGTTKIYYKGSPKEISRHAPWVELIAIGK